MTSATADDCDTDPLNLRDADEDRGGGVGCGGSGGSGDESSEVCHSLPDGDDDADEEESIEGGEATTMQTIAGVAGNVLEWYDFAVFGYFGDIIGDVFFPPQAGHAAIVESFAVFGAAFMMRPIGGMIMGYIGDKFGRKRALELSIFLMAFPTFGMGCLPSYDRIGSAAIVLLALNGASRAFPSVDSSANCGTLMGGIVGFIMRSTLSDEALRSWGWRVPFLMGILVSLTGFYLKYHCAEVHALHGAHAQDTPPNPIKAAFSRGNRRSLLSATLVPMLWSAGFYLTFVWLSIFMSELVVPPVPDAFAVNSLSLAFSVCLIFPLGGRVSDWYGRRRIMITGGIGMGLLSPLCVIIIGWGNPFASFFAQSTMGICLTLWGAPMMAWLVEGFPPHARLTSVGIGYNIAQATAGGFTPAIATFLVDKYGEHAPGFILTVLAALSLLGLLVAPKRRDGLGAVYTGEHEELQHEQASFSTGTDQFDEERSRLSTASGARVDAFYENDMNGHADNTREII
eukprot:CAMPEP_0178663974 /NCGR_PEP_ID=MMETSP0698-20121128/29129_1 /TAXON_ID=265572 /ORGANISM="Extubocellulus spinifer, Strain CCMP396" /LENGTH=512 /DNA_ID=CAMNT_0020307103 /DNA_START=61 /DNA_END=1600 /DNA_ORIENTATION=-